VGGGGGGHGDPTEGGSARVSNASKPGAFLVGAPLILGHKGGKSKISHKKNAGGFSIELTTGEILNQVRAAPQNRHLEPRIRKKVVRLGGVKNHGRAKKRSFFDSPGGGGGQGDAYYRIRGGV